MAKRKSPETRLQEAYDFQDFLLWVLMGQNMGKKPEHPVPEGIATFPEKKAFLDLMFKSAEQGRKSQEDKPEVSGLDMLRKGLANERRESSSRGNSREADSESGSDSESASDST